MKVRVEILEIKNCQSNIFNLNFNKDIYNLVFDGSEKLIVVATLLDGDPGSYFEGKKVIDAIEYSND